MAETDVKVVEQQPVYIVTDAIDGDNEVIHICRLESTAYRLATYAHENSYNGCALRVALGFVLMVSVPGAEALIPYFRCDKIVEPTAHDQCVQDDADLFNKAKLKAEELGLPAHMITALINGPKDSNHDC